MLLLRLYSLFFTESEGNNVKKHFVSSDFGLFNYSYLCHLILKD